MFITLTLVALGGAIGASLRYLFGVAVYRMGATGDFPIAILSVNVIGSFVMGAFVIFAAQRGLTHLSPFVMTGILGGFTTFSAFSLETVTLLERGQAASALVYVTLSVGLSIMGLMAGVLIMRGLLT